MEPLTYKLVTDHKDKVEGLELWQNGQHVTISLAAKGTHENGHRWVEVKAMIDKIQERYNKQALEDLREMYGSEALVLKELEEE